MSRDSRDQRTTLGETAGGQALKALQATGGETTINHRGMKRWGTLAEAPVLAVIVEAILDKVHHFSLPNGQRLKTKVMANGACVGVDLDNRRYVSQNPTKGSEEAERVRAGASIVWVIQTHNDETGAPLTNAYIGKIEDGIVYMR